ncbi:MAG TPA: DUF3078 domain-containing protein [Candidatus Kapabacteria bacterium]|nr:DUF3078 domain-containing protein [Candidatus Kapabacteria bacterium]
MRSTFILFFCAFTLSAFAQDSTKALTPPDTFGWKHTLVSMLTLTQSSYKDWAQGGDDALAYTGTISGKSVDDEQMTNWTTTYRFAFGQANLANQGARKTDDAIDVSSVYLYKLDKYVNPYISVALLSQFAPGYTYDDSGRATQVSKFFDPGYLTEAAGFGYTSGPQFKTRLGFAMREVFTSEFTQYANDPGATQIVKTRVDGGLQSVTEVNLKIDDNVLFTAKLDLFDAFKSFKQIIVNSDNTITAKVSKYISAGLDVQFINDHTVSTRTQIKEGLGLNLSYSIF